MNVREMLAQRAALVLRAREINAAAEKENRDLNAEEQGNYDKIFAEITALEKRQARAQALEASETETRSAEPVLETGAESSPKTAEQRKAFSAFLRTGALTPEFRAMQADVDAAGGFYTTPEQFVKRLIKAVDDQTFIRTWATVESVTQAQSLGLPYLAANPADADWTSELGTGDEDSTMAFGKRELSPKPLAKRIKVSNKLLRLSPDVESLVIERLAYKFGITYEKACLTGSGAGQPLGLFVASADGIPTTRDVATGNATTAIQTDGLIEAKYTLKATYWPRAKWLFHRDAIKQLAKLQNDDGDYLWQPSVQMGQPDMLFGVPVFASEYVPNTFTTGQYVGMIGDFSLYHIVDALDFSVQRLNELYAANNQTGFIGRMESDGMPVLAEAFVRVKLA